MCYVTLRYYASVDVVSLRLDESSVRLPVKNCDHQLFNSMQVLAINAPC